MPWFQPWSFLVNATLINALALRTWQCLQAVYSSFMECLKPSTALKNRTTLLSKYDGPKGLSPCRCAQ